MLKAATQRPATNSAIGQTFHAGLTLCEARLPGNGKCHANRARVGGDEKGARLSASSCERFSSPTASSDMARLA